MTGLGAVCDAAEDYARDGAAPDAPARAIVLVHASGVPGPDWAGSLPVSLVSKWERGLRRLERVPAVTIAVADQDCGGTALDVLLATDYRIMAAAASLIVPAAAGATWPGMAVYRLIRQAASAPAARRAVLFGAPVGAAAALAIGVVDEVTDDVAAAVATASELGAAAPGTELAVMRQLMQEALTTSHEDALGAHLAACDRALRRLAAGVP